MEEQAKSAKPAVSAWAYLNLAMNAALILLCMFLLHHVQQVSAHLNETMQQVQSISQTVGKIESYVANMSLGPTTAPQR